jgi:hypothetical protein
MARGRRGSDNPVSFFSFQDVMMCTIGVTIVITMILVLQLGAAAAKVESELPADHARDAAYMEIVREMMNCSTDNKLILGWALTYVSRSNVLVRKKASIEL